MKYEKENKNSNRKQILETINDVFRPSNGETFNFKTFIPKVYGSDSFNNIHHLLKNDEDKLVSVIGNLIEDYEVNSKKYLMSFVGSVSTIKEYEHHGYMKILMDKVDKENIDKNVAASFLRGLRNRYEYYSYYLSGIEYVFNFNESNIKHSNMINKDLELTISLTKKEETLELFNIYLRTTDLIIRNKDNFYSSICSHNYIPYTISHNNLIIGYLLMENESNYISEVCLIDNNYLLSVLSSLLDKMDLESIELVVNGYDNNLIKEALKIAENYYVNKQLNIKIYDYKKFLEYAFNLNKKRIFIDGELILSVDDKNIKICVTDNKVLIEYTNNKGIKLTKKEFASLFSIDYFALSLNLNSWFPLAISVPRCDKF